MVTSRPVRATATASRTLVECGVVADDVVGGERAEDRIGSHRSTKAAASAIAGIESRALGSAMSRPAGIPGSWSATAAVGDPVTTTRRSPTSGPNRSAVAWRRSGPIR